MLFYFQRNLPSKNICLYDIERSIYHIVPRFSRNIIIQVRRRSRCGVLARCEKHTPRRINNVHSPYLYSLLLFWQRSIMLHVLASGTCAGTTSSLDTPLAKVFSRISSRVAPVCIILGNREARIQRAYNTCRFAYDMLAILFDCYRLSQLDLNISICFSSIMFLNIFFFCVSFFGEMNIT